MPHIIALSVRLYRRALRLYPPEYRERFEVGQLQDFRDHCKDTYRRRGWLAITRLWVRELPGLVRGIEEARSDAAGPMPARFFVIQLINGFVLVAATMPTVVCGIVPWTQTLIMLEALFVETPIMVYTGVVLLRRGGNLSEGLYVEESEE